MKKFFPVPDELNHPFFFPEQEIQWVDKDTSKLYVQEPFIHELAYYLKRETIRPWESNEESVKELLEQWYKLRERLEQVFSKREKDQALGLMKVGVGFFIEFLYWGNGFPSVLAPSISYHDLLIKPVNMEERLQFILTRPTLYHSFIQLSELMTEQQKLFYKNLAMKNRTNQ